jgi:ribosome-associated protein
MSDMLQADNKAAIAQEELSCEIGKMLLEHKAEAVVVMDMRKLNFWTDFFVIATPTSGAHLSGLERHIKDYCAEKGIDIFRRSQKPESDDEWSLIDLGGIVIHLMSGKARAFYELERLWGAAEVIYSS